MPTTWSQSAMVSCSIGMCFEHAGAGDQNVEFAVPLPRRSDGRSPDPPDRARRRSPSTARSSAPRPGGGGRFELSLSSRSNKTTDAPWRRNSSAIEQPMSPTPPVISATLSFSLMGIFTALMWESARRVHATPHGLQAHCARNIPGSFQEQRKTCSALPISPARRQMRDLDARRPWADRRRTMAAISMPPSPG